MRNQFGMKCIAVFLAAWMAFTEFVPVTAYAQNIEAEKSHTASQEAVASDALPEQSNPVHEQTSADQEETEPAQQEEKTLLPVYQNQTILIYTYAQLLQIGSGAAVTDTDAEADQLDKGQAVMNEDGEPVTYSLDAQYTIVQDIPLTMYYLSNSTQIQRMERHRLSAIPKQMAEILPDRLSKQLVRKPIFSSAMNSSSAPSAQMRPFTALSIKRSWKASGK